MLVVVTDLYVCQCENCTGLKWEFSSQAVGCIREISYIPLVACCNVDSSSSLSIDDRKFFLVNYPDKITGQYFGGGSMYVPSYQVRWYVNK